MQAIALSNKGEIKEHMQAAGQANYTHKGFANQRRWHASRGMGSMQTEQGREVRSKKIHAWGSRVELPR
jgi:hypothetical protein